ncbi:MAG: BFD-like (2Fe-2S) protein [Deltaproteobacteria bacterium SG8_13]|nr:MAG: BFD-like (2Fe-2S) protein [Deltaproteobacteria bacterium SG8_13]
MSEMICYCFTFSRQDIVKDFGNNGRSTIMEMIAREKQLGRCDCAAKNPKGR